MAIGIIRRIDELGRIVIPIEIRRATGIDVLIRTDLTIENSTLHLVNGSGRHIDELGRYCIPKEIRRRYGWDTGQEMEVYADGETVCIRKYGCEWCDNTEDLIEVKRHKICRDCAEAVEAKLDGGSL